MEHVMENYRKLILDLIETVALSHVFAAGIRDEHQKDFFSHIINKFFEITITSLELENDEIYSIIFEAQVQGENHINDIKNKIQ